MYIEKMASSIGPRAAIYTRISRDITGEGEGVQRQEEACRKLAAGLGLEVSAIYSDNDIGASNRTGAKPRPGYDSMLEAVRAGAISTIIAYSNSRLTRRPKEWIELIGLAESGKLEIKTEVSGSHDLTSGDGRALAITVAAWDAAESDRISERQKLTFERKAYEGKPKRQRQRPFGWEDDGTTVRESEARLIREAVEEIKAGASIASIQHRWNRAGIRTAVDPAQSKKEEKPDGQWEWSVVYRVLLGWRTVGIRTRHREPLRDADGQLVRGAWDRIIDPEDREQALAMLSRLSRKKLRTGSWPLAGILRCGECTKPLYGQLPSGTRSRSLYACKKGHVGISAGLLEQYLIKESVRRAYEASHHRASNRPEPKRAEEWPQYDDLVSKSRLIDELMTAYKAGELRAGFAIPQVDELDREREELQRQLDAFLAVQPAPESPLRRTSEALEWLMEMQGPFLRITPGKVEEWQKNSGDVFGPVGIESLDSVAQDSSWGPSTAAETHSASTTDSERPGAKKERPQELPYSASLEETEELNRLLRGELEMVVIRKGKAGRQSESKFQERIDPVWRD